MSEPYYRMLGITRAYALGKLADSGEAATVARRHAEGVCGLLEDAAEGDTARWIDNVRGALAWAFSPAGDAALGARLTAAAVPLWVRRSLMAECRKHVELALAGPDDRDPRLAMQLQAALGAALTYTTRPVPETLAAWQATLLLARDLGDTEYELRALRGLWAYRMNASEYRAALSLAEEFRALAARQPDPGVALGGDRMAGLILHYLGDQPAARRLVEPIAADPAPPPAPAMRFLLDQPVAADALLARILWLQGFADQAAAAADRAVARAQRIGHALSLCHALAQAACPVALWTGDLDAADRCVSLLLEQATQSALDGWIARGRCFAGLVAIRRGRAAEAVALLQQALGALRAAGSMAEYPAFLAALAVGLGHAGPARRGQRRDRGGDHPGGQYPASNGAPPNCIASLANSPCWIMTRRRRNATSPWRSNWRGRSLCRHTSCAPRPVSRGCWPPVETGEARQLLATTRSRFREGFSSADVIAADTLLGEL